MGFKGVTEGFRDFQETFRGAHHHDSKVSKLRSGSERVQGISADFMGFRRLQGAALKFKEVFIGLRNVFRWVSRRFRGLGLGNFRMLQLSLRSKLSREYLRGYSEWFYRISVVLRGSQEVAGEFMVFQ